MYNIYLAEEGCGLVFLGCVERLEDAPKLFSQPGLEESLWDTARTSGHCAGYTAPMPDAEEPAQWWGWYCACKVKEKE